MSSTLKLDDISIDIDTLFHSIDCGICVFRIYEQQDNRANHIVVEQFNNESERIIGINLDSFAQSVTALEDLITPEYKTVLKDVYSKLSASSEEIQFELEIVNFMHKTVFLMSNCTALNKSEDELGNYIRVQSAFMDITKLKHKEERISNIIRHDPLTNVLNRSAYEHDISQLKNNMHFSQILPNDGNYITFVVIDINELKTINDNLGHSAGDEIIRATALIVQESMKNCAVIYRTGGDEFFVIMKTQALNEVRSCLTELHARADRWTGYQVKHMTLSVGYKSFNLEDKDIDIKKFIKIADKRMFDAKRYYYLTQGVDRRIQQNVYDALCNSFQKILRIDLKQDSFNIIKIEFNESDILKGSRKSYSDWNEHFSKSDLVFKDDKTNFKKLLSREHLINFFMSGKNMFSITYRRKFADTYKKVLLEVIPEGKFSAQNQAVYLYVKQIEI